LAYYYLAILEKSLAPSGARRADRVRPDSFHVVPTLTGSHLEKVFRVNFVPGYYFKNSSCGFEGFEGLHDCEVDWTTFKLFN
jgi:hypothetical protein